MVSVFCCLGQFVWYLFSFCWLSLWTWSLLCSEPMQDICISGVLSEDTGLPVVTIEGWSTWLLLCDVVCQPHYILLTLCGVCPTASRDLYEWVCYIQLSSDFHLDLGWSTYQKRAWNHLVLSLHSWSVCGHL